MVKQEPENTDVKYYGGNIWQAPSCIRALISLSGESDKMILVSDPSSNSGSMTFVEKDGTWLYTIDELKERLKEWKWISALGEPTAEPELELEEGSAKMTLQDIYAMFYILVKQSQNLHPGSKMSFDLRAFKTLPKKPQIWFERKDGRLFAWIPEKPKDRKKLTKSKLFLPDNRIITIN